MLASCRGPGASRQDPAVCHHGGPSLECLEALNEIADPGMDYPLQPEHSSSRRPSEFPRSAFPQCRSPAHHSMASRFTV